MGTVLMTPVTDFIEDAVALVVSCTHTTVTETMWQAFDLIYESIHNNYIEDFPEVVPPLYNFIANGADVLVSDGQKLEKLYELVKHTWEVEDVDDTLAYVAKLMELMMTFLGSSELMGRCVEPFLELVVAKLLEDDDEQPLALRTQCLNVFIAGLSYNVTEVLKALEQTQDGHGRPLTMAILEAWFTIAHDINDWHNRRTCILGLCSIMQAPLQDLPASVQQAWPHLLPVLMKMFDGLKEARERAHEDDSDDEEDYDSQPLDNLLAQIVKRIQEKEERTVVDDAGEWASFDTPYDDEDRYDVYVIARDTLQSLQERDPAAYEALFSDAVSPDLVTQLAAEAHEREQAARQKAAEQQQQQWQQQQGGQLA